MAPVDPFGRAESTHPPKKRFRTQVTRHEAMTALLPRRVVSQNRGNGLVAALYDVCKPSAVGARRGLPNDVVINNGQVTGAR
jgi:hypothetical protein